jgi:hypothetical protein
MAEEFEPVVAVGRALPYRPQVERIYSRKQVEQALLQAFELTGGITRLALWANQEENYSDYLKLLMKLLPRETKEELASLIEYKTYVPPSRLNHFPNVERELGSESEG